MRAMVKLWALLSDVRFHMKTLPAMGLAGMLLATALLADAPAGQEATKGSDAPTRGAADWPLERVTLTDGKVYQGLIAAQRPSTIEFIEVHRPPGKPMFLVVRPIARKMIAQWERLAPEEQQALRAKLDEHRRRALIEGRRMEDLALTETRVDGRLLWNYRGYWFTLESTADEQMTRRVIVRLDQLFRAYRQLLRPRLPAPERVHIKVFGAREEYLAALDELGLAIDNPAVFLADKNLILAGSEMNRFAAELAQVGREHRQVKQQIDAQLADAPARLKQLGEDLKTNGVPTAQRMRILVAEHKKWDDLRKAAQRKIAALDRKNSAKFHEVAGQMFARLGHEAFHAYLETHVYPRNAYDVPRWLNEGLAQTFEAGLLEADSLRVDTPNAAALEQLQSDLRGETRLELADLLVAGGQTFLSAHAGAQAASRAYYYSWGLAYYLAFDQGVLGSEGFDEYLSPTANGKSAIERFERLVGMPLDAFESRWREAMLGLKTSP